MRDSSSEIWLLGSMVWSSCCSELGVPGRGGGSSRKSDVDETMSYASSGSGHFKRLGSWILAIGIQEGDG